MREELTADDAGGISAGVPAADEAEGVEGVMFVAGGVDGSPVGAEASVSLGGCRGAEEAEDGGTGGKAEGGRG